MKYSGTFVQITLRTKRANPLHALTCVSFHFAHPIKRYVQKGPISGPNAYHVRVSLTEGARSCLEPNLAKPDRHMTPASVAKFLYSQLKSYFENLHVTQQNYNLVLAPICLRPADVHGVYTAQLDIHWLENTFSNKQKFHVSILFQYFSQSKFICEIISGDGNDAGCGTIFHQRQ